MVDHTVKSFDRELDTVERRIAEMGGIAEKMVADAIDALASADTILAHQVSSRQICDSTRCSATSRISR
jgi:phosphate transport system protein